MAHSAQDRDVLSAQERDIDGHLTHPGEQAPFLAPERESRLLHQFSRLLGQSPLARKTNP